MKPKPAPTIPITDPRFVYVSSDKTNIRARFEAVRRELAQPKADKVRKIK